MKIAQAIEASDLVELADTFAGRLRMVMSGATQAEFAKLIGLSQAGLNKLLQGGEPRLGTLIAIANATGTSVGWLAAGGKSTGAFGTYVAVQKLSFRASAGAGFLVLDEDDQYIQYPKLILDHVNIKPENALTMEAWGDSMWPTIQDGSLLLIDKSETELREGKIFVFTVGDEVFVKRLRRSGRNVMKVSDNKEFFPEEPVRADEPFSMIGRVKWTERSL